jgi:alanine racemase
LFNISNTESIPFDQVSSYVNKKLEEKKKIDEQIKEADDILQSKNVNIETINEHVKLNETLNKLGLSTHDINKLVKLVVNAKKYGFDSKKIVGKL